MIRFDVDRIMGRLSQLAPALVQPILPEAEDAPETGYAPETGFEAASALSGTDAAPANPLYARLMAVEVPGGDWGAEGLALCRERVPGSGEDACLAAVSGERRLLGVFDGCGGSGAKVYEAFGGHTGAWVASRAVSLAARDWFLDAGGEGEDGELADRVRDALEECKAQEIEGQLLMGSLSREFPTTAAAFIQHGDEIDLFWCGDSRCYALDGGGLRQLTVDDADITDAMRNLREDAPMTNVICASRPFVIHTRRLKLKAPALVLAATDGCFGYLPSPMAFEALLLETMTRANDFGGWQRALDERLREISGDDYTLMARPWGFKDYKAMKRALGKRLALLRRRYPQANATEEALESQWREYRTDYEALLPGDGASEGRD